MADCLVVRVEGELDAAGYPEFSSVLERAVRTGGRCVVVDLRPTRFLSLRAATMLGSVKQRSSGSGSELRLVAGRADVERALEVTGVRPLFRPYTSMRDALAG
ncbi:STAS domain-containing protein [Nocardia asteroides]|uniref:STAS domain-containing protein n=1 Tax=Nocardia asteroides TaxID=1824 RepID=UPI001E4BD418|nr:STAS domain-containing protein [Nocardia asteroides]UGT60963.1 STAS domain-containing protein [Nocardia asteroides]